MDDLDIKELDTFPITKDRGRIFIYDTLTGDRSEVLVTMLPQQLRKTRKDGSLVFTTVKPDFEPVKGTIKCLLHPDDPNRAYYDTLGLPTCPKSNITSTYHLIGHMRHRHKMEYGVIEQSRLDIEKVEEKEFRQKLFSKAANK